MQTGYDNYWMYHNRRHELVLCYPKNDNFSHPVFTDSYKQVQGMGNPSNLCNYIPHPNTVARPHQKDSNDQHRVTSTQSMWPSSVCIQPYTSSLTHNFLPHEVCSVQPNNMYDSSQPLQSQVLRNVENCNVNFNPGQNVNYKASADSVNNQNTCNYKAQTARIRVKDISLLNNNRNSNYNSLLNSDLHQAQQKKHNYYPFDSAATRQNKIYNGQTQRDCAKYGSTAMSDLNHSYQNFGPPTSHKFHLSNEEQYPQSSAAFYQQNAQFTCERQFYCNKVQHMSEKSSEDFNKGNYPAPLRKNLNKNVIQETDEFSTQSGLERHSDNNASANKNNAFSLPGLSEPNGMNTTSQTQPPMPEITQTSLLNPISSASKSCTEGTAKNSPHNPLNGREISTFKITIPSTAQGTISLNDSIFSELNRNSGLCLPSTNPVSTTLRGSSAHDEVNTQKDLPEISDGTVVFSGSENTCSGISQLFDQQEPIDGCGINEENRIHPSENPRGEMRPEICRQPNNNETAVAVCQSERVLDCSVKPKVENLDAGKDNFENGSAVCTEGGAVQAIKSEVDFFAQNPNTEQFSDPYFFEGTELPDTENAENNNSSILKKPGPKSKTMSAASNYGQESKMQDVILENAGNSFEEQITIEDTEKVQGDENEEVALVLGGKCKSEINRDKLDLLIKFLKKDGGLVEIHSLMENSCSSPLTKSPKEKSQNQSRRKLSKTCVVKNKNTQREMISLVSHKTPKHSLRSSFSKNSLNEPSEMRNSCGENGPTEISDCLGNKVKSTSKEEQLKESTDDLSDGRRQTKNMSAENKPLKEMTGNCSRGEKGITTEERNIINVMRAFQNLKNHFCANCDFTSPAESIWINVVSGELRCLNCFKKMMLKAEENVSNSKKCNVEGVNTLKAFDVDKHDVGDESKNKEEKSFEKKSKCEGHMPTKDAFKSEDLEDHVMEEVGMQFENISEDLEDENTVAVNRITGKEQCDPSTRKVSDEQGRPEVKTGREKSTKANGSEEHASEKHRKGGSKQTLDLQERSRKRSNSAEEFVPHKVQILEEPTEDIKQEKTVLWDRCIQKSLSKECSSSHKIQISEEVAKKSKKHETPGRSKASHSIEGCIEQKSYKTEQSKVKEDEVEHEPKRKGDEVSGKSKGKLMTSDEEVDLKKIGAAKECNKALLYSSEKQEVGHSAEKLKMRSESKEEGDKNKILMERGIKEETKDWSGNVKERFHDLKRNEEDLNKAAELIDLLRKLKKKSNPSQRKRAKAEALDPTYVPPKGISREGGTLFRMRRKNEEFDLTKSHLPKEKKKESNHERSAWKNDKTTKHERKTKHCFQKMPELSDSEKSSGKNTHKKLIDKHYRKSKQCLISRLFKGKQNTRVNPSGKFVDREARKMQELRKEHRGQEERRSEMNTEKNRSHSQTHPKTSNRAVEIGSDTRKLSGGEPADEKRNWESPIGKEVPAQKSSCPRKTKNKAVRDIFGEIIKDVGGALKSKNLDKEIIYSTALLARLLKKTKKLSWSLLGET